MTDQEGPTGPVDGFPEPGATPMAAEGPAGASDGWSIAPQVPDQVPAPASRRPWRWWIAIAVTVLVVATAAAAALVTTRGAADSPTIAWVPANAIVYAEGRLDVPGDQGAALASLLSNFPGFADTSNLQSKLGQTWDRLLTAAGSGATFSYTGDVAPWFQGTVGVAVLPGAAAAPPRVVVIAAVADQAKAQAELDKVVAEAKKSGAGPKESTVSGATVWTFAPPAGADSSASGSGSGSSAGTEPRDLSVALLQGAFVATSDPTAITAVQEAKDGRAAALPASAPYRSAVSGAASPALASLYVSTSAIQQEVRALAPSAAPLASPVAGCATQAAPEAVYGTLRAEADRLVVDLRGQLTNGTPAAPHDSTLVDHVPGTALAYFETHDAGRALGCVVAQLKAAASASGSTGTGTSGGAASGADSIGQIEGLLGGSLESFVSWMGDAGVIVDAPTSTQPLPRVALIATVTDQALATQRLEQLTSLVKMVGSMGVSGLTVTETRHGSATVTTITLPTSGLASAAPAGASGAFPASVTIGWAIADGGDPKLGGRFILGLGPDTVTSLLDQSTAQSLGATPAFSQALASAGGPSTTGFAYVDLRALRGAAESAMPSSERANYDANVKPYLLPFDRLVTVNGVSGSTMTSRTIVTVGKP